MKPFIFHVCSWVAVLWFLLVPLHASETDWPSPDALMRDAIATAVQVNPDTGPKQVGRFIRERLRQEAGPGDYKQMLDELERDREQPREQPYGMLLEQIFPVVLESFDLDAYRRLLMLVPEYNRCDACNRIVQYCFEHGRLMDESLRLPEGVKENQSGHKSILEDELPNIVLARECSKIEPDGSVSPTAQRSVFRKFNRYNYREERFLVAKWFWVSSAQREKLLEAIKSTKAGEDEKAKTLFDEAFHAIPNRGVPDQWGAYNPSGALCAIALIQIELGKPDWARELIPKIVISERDNSMQQYALGLRMKIADLRFMLNELAAARKTIEDLGEPVSPRVWCDLAVALFERSDAGGAREVLEAVLDHLEKAEHARGTDVDVFFETVFETGDDELAGIAIDRLLKIAEPKTNVYRIEFQDSILKALVRLRRFDDAMKLSKEKMKDRSMRTIAEGLVAAKKYDEAEKYVTPLTWNELRAETMRTVAKGRFDDGDEKGACKALNKAIKFAHIRYGRSYKPMFDIAWDVTKYRQNEMKRSVSDIAEEVFRFHRDLLAKVKTDSKDFDDEELRHLLQIIGRAKQKDYPDYELVKNKLRSFGPTIYPVILSTAFDAPDGFAAADMLELVDIPKADAESLRKAILKIWAKHPNFGNLNDIAYKILDQIGTTEDVPALTAGPFPVEPLFKLLGKLATASQLPEVEKAAVTAKERYFEWFRGDGIRYLEDAKKRWNETLQPEIDKTLETIRRREHE